MTLMAFSQTDTKRDSVLVLSIPVAKKVVKDLILGDAAKEELSVTKEILKETESKIAIQGYMIGEYMKKAVKYDSLLILYNKQEIIYKDLTSKLQKDLKAQKRKSFIQNTSFMGIIGILTYFLITK